MQIQNETKVDSEDSPNVRKQKMHELDQSSMSRYRTQGLYSYLVSVIWSYINMEGGLTKFSSINTSTMKTTNLFMSLSLLLLLACFPANAILQPTLHLYDHANLPKGVVGPESFAFDCYGQGPYTGVADGRILKWEGSLIGWTEFATTAPLRTKIMCDRSTKPWLESTCGRPLGLQFHSVTCDLYVADAYHGLMRVGPNGGRATPLVSSAEKVPFMCTNSVDIDYENDIVYFTDSSTKFQRKDHLRSVQSGDATGRLMRYDIKTGQVIVLLRGLRFANGVALSKDRSYVLVAETGKRQIRKYWLQGPKAYKDEVFSRLRDAPDNLNMNANGDVWVALNNGQTLPTHNGGEIIALRLDGDDGRILEALQGDGIMESVCEVQEYMDKLYVGSLSMPFMGVSKI